MANQEYTLESFQNLIKSYLETSQKEKLQLEESTNILNSKVERLQCELDTANETLSKKDEMLKRLKEEYDKQLKELASKTEEQNNVLFKLKCTENELDKLKENLESMNIKNQGNLSSEKLLLHLNDVIRENDNLIHMKNNIITENEEEMEKLRKEIEKLKAVSAELSSKVPKERKLSQTYAQTDITEENLLNEKREKEQELLKQNQLISNYEVTIKKLNDENLYLKNVLQSTPPPQDTTEIEKRLVQVQENLNALKSVLHRLKESKELEAATMKDEMIELMDSLRNKYMEIENALTKRNRNLEEIIDTLNKLLNQSSDNISEIQEELLTSKKGQREPYNFSNIMPDSNNLKQNISPHQRLNKYEAENISVGVSNELYPYYVGPKTAYSSETFMTPSPVISKVTPTDSNVSPGVKVNNVFGKTYDPEKLQLKNDLDSLKNELKKCKCNRSGINIPEPKRSKIKEKSRSVTDLNQQLLSLLGKINFIINRLNDLENSVLDFHHNIRKFCMCNVLPDEGRNIINNIETNMTEVDSMIFETENDFNKLENRISPIVKSVKGNEDGLSITKSSDFVQLQSSLFLIIELFKEIHVRRDCIKKDFALVKQECEDLKNLQPSTDINRTKKALKDLPKKVKIYIPKNRVDSNTFIMYVPDDGYQFNTPVPSVSSNQVRVIQLSPESNPSQSIHTVSNKLGRENIGDAPPKDWLIEAEHNPFALSEKNIKPVTDKDVPQIWNSKSPISLCKECGLRKPDNLSPQNLKNMSVNRHTSTSEIKIVTVQQNERIQKTQSGINQTEMDPYTNRSILAYYSKNN